MNSVLIRERRAEMQAKHHPPREGDDDAAVDVRARQLGGSREARSAHLDVSRPGSRSDFDPVGGPGGS